MRQDVNGKGLVSGFLNSAVKFPDRPALAVGEECYSYAQLAELAFSIASRVKDAGSASPLVAVLAERSVMAYAGILGSLSAGKGYVPLNPTFPEQRLHAILEASGCEVVIVGSEALSVLPGLLRRASRRMKVILLDRAAAGTLEPGEGELLFLAEKHHAGAYQVPDVGGTEIAYLLFTSGSTGVPKGVPVSHDNAAAFIDTVCRRYSFTEEDRFSQTADLNFDLSVLEVFPCWERGGCLCPLPRKHVMAPASFIRKERLTVWVSVPSVGIFMSRMRLMRPNAFPTLRWCLFCGEPMLARIADCWQVAAPQAVIENLYGPTEATVAITAYTWAGDDSRRRSRNGIVPIGWPFAGQRTCIVDGELRAVSRGTAGELCLSGSQVTAGYFNDAERTARHYTRLEDSEGAIWYRTGDLAIEDGDGCYHHLGRIDDQVKILGYRVELAEVDSVLRAASGCDLAVAVPETDAEGNVVALIGFVSETKLAAQALLDACRDKLPHYMVPREVRVIGDMPMNSNGKIDRRALSRRVGERS